MDQDKVATTAHSIILFADHLEALKIRFPSSGEERGVTKALFHPRFARSSTTQMATQAMTEYIPQVSVQKNNAVVLLTRPTLPDLGMDAIAKLIQKNSVPSHAIEQGMGGSLAELDLAMVLQTITNARKEGILVITDERNRTIARIFCQDGKVLHAEYKGLINEYALYQIIESKLDGNFHFRSAKQPDWLCRRPIHRPPDMLLIESHRRYDELPKLYQEMGGPDSIWFRVAPELNTTKLTGDSLDRAKALWPVLDGTMPAKELWRVSGLDDFAVYQTIAELKQSMQVHDQEQPRVPYNRKPEPIPVAVQISLKPHDEIESLTVDPIEGRPFVRKGNLLGSLREADPNHLVHNLVLPPEAAGCPIFKEGHVIGMHCGSLPPEPETSDGTRLQQMLWVEVIMQCLMQGGEAALARKLSQSAIDIPKPPPGEAAAKPGCLEVARVNCSKCGASHLESSRFCKTCGQKLISDIDYKPRKAAFANSSMIMVMLLGAILLGTAVVLARAPQPEIISTDYVMKPEMPWVKVEGKFNELKKGTQGVFQDYKNGQVLHSGQGFYVKINVDEPSFVYVLCLQSSGGNISTLFPPSKEVDPKFVKDTRPKGPDGKPLPIADESLLQPGDFFTCPPGLETNFAARSEKEDKNVERTGWAVADPPGADTFIALSSHYPLSIYGDQAATNEVYKKASEILDQFEPTNGIEIDADLLKPGLLAVNKNSSGASATQSHQRNSVYLSRLAVRHR